MSFAVECSWNEASGKRVGTVQEPSDIRDVSLKLPRSLVGAFDDVNDGFCISLVPHISQPKGSGMFQSSQTRASATAKLCALHGWQPAARVALEDEVIIRSIPVGRSGAMKVSFRCTI
ncbi:hypothetical protein B296_00042159 [Ensete ventricosum]|uniref:Uncharacterized protein n=1 Tax=Ensete ventricosum TaxID=4639 RepID=A0A426X774_ENSVE|nr:hypothetical protein B296_00042159 [Ensete ventricosum]